MPFLIPFGADPNPSFRLSGEVLWENTWFKLHMRWQGGLIHPSSSVKSREFLNSQLNRADGLWGSTCFEMFWSAPASLAYWELNLSPWGGWNVYEFSNYRQPQPPQPSKTFQVRRLCWELTADDGRSGQMAAEVECLGVPLQNFEYNLCAVIPFEGGHQYYSIRHSGEKPDFHRRDCLRQGEGQ